MTVDLKLVESFVLIVRSGGLTQAQALSGLSKATLSRQITRLEELMGAQLLIRTSRRVTPTEAGRAFFLHCESLLDEVNGRLEAAHTEVQEMTVGVSGTLSLLSDTQFSTSFVCHVVKHFLESHPDVRCKLDVANGVNAPPINEVDCYICAEPPDMPNLVAKLLGRLNYGLYASPRYLERYGAPQCPGDLAQHKSIMMMVERSSDKAPVLLLSQAESHAFRPAPSFTTNDYWVMKAFCTDGFGIALLPDFFTRPEVKQALLVPVLPQWKPEARRIYCAFQRQRYMGRKVRAFVDLMAHSIIDIDSSNSYIASTDMRDAASSRR